MADFDFSALKFGLLPNDPAMPRMQFGDIFTGVVPEHPAAADHLDGTTGWKMLGNDRWGVCVAVTMADKTKHVTAKLATEDYPDQAEVFQLYATQNGGLDSRGLPRQDGGMVIQNALTWWSKNVWAGRKLVAFAAVNFHDPAQLKAAIAIFGGVVIGFTVTRATMQQFSAKQPFDYVRGSGATGGHCVMVGGYRGLPTDHLTLKTWGTLTAGTQAWVTNQWTECWIPILPEHLGTKAFQQGVNGKKLAEAYFQLTGRILDVPDVPPVTPDPPSSTSQTWMITGDNLKITRIS